MEWQSAISEHPLFKFFSQSVNLTRYVVQCACPSVCLPVPVSFWRGFVANTNIYHCWGVS